MSTRSLWSKQRIDLKGSRTASTRICPQRPDWVELIGSTVTRIPEFSYGTIARPIRP